MPIPKLEITNPEAIAFINKVKSGEFFVPYKNWLKKYRWYLVSAAVVVVLIISLVIGKALSEKATLPAVTPPAIEEVTPTTQETVRSTFSGLKTEIQEFSPDMPDPYLPSLDNKIDLEEKAK